MAQIVVEMTANEAKALAALRNVNAETIKVERSMAKMSSSGSKAQSTVAGFTPATPSGPT